MKHLIALCISVALLLLGCNKNPVSPQITNNSNQFTIKITDYSESNYFIDTIYADTSTSLNMFYKYYGNVVPEIIPKYIVTNIEVYASVDEFDTQTDIKGNAYIDLPPRDGEKLYSEHYRDSLAHDSIGKYYTGNFRKLMDGTEYVLNDNTGWLSFSFKPKDSQIIAVAYTILGDQYDSSNSITYGEYLPEIVNAQKKRIVLKLVKPPYLNPSMSEAWKLQLKNVYKIEEIYSSFNKINLDIYYRGNNNTLIDKVDNNELLNLFGFDNYSDDGTLKPDGKFDYIPGIDFLPSTMKIIFPSLEPFGNNLPSILPDSLRRLDIYTQSKSTLDTLKNTFIIKGNYLNQ